MVTPPRRRTLATPQALTPITFAHDIVQAYAQAGRDPAHALAAAQIMPSLLKKPGARITAPQLETLSAHAMRELDDEALGWFSRRLPWGSYGMLARASLTAPTLGVALARWCRHHALLTDDIALRLNAPPEGDATGSAILALEEHRDLSAHGRLREFCHVTLLRNALGLASWYIDSRIALQQAHFAFAAPPHAATYAAVLFPAPQVSFGHARTEVRFAAAYLAQPLRRDEAALRQMLRSRALSLIVLPHRRDRLLVQQVRQLIAADPAQPHSADSLAERLHLSARTLHRQLKEEGASLQQLKDEVRCEKAKELLLRTKKPVKQVAAAVGFGNEKSFVRAFGGWVGVGPGEYRKTDNTTIPSHRDSRDKRAISDLPS